MSLPRRISPWRILAFAAPLCVVYPLKASEYLPPLEPVVAQRPDTATPRLDRATRPVEPEGDTYEPFAHPTAGLVSGGRVNVRWGPGTQHGIVTVMTGGEALVATGRMGKWVEIEWPADACAWVSKYYCTSEGVITGDRVRIRARGRLDARILREAAKGERVQVLGEAGDWYKITAPDGARAYIFGKYTVLGGDPPASAPNVLPPIVHQAAPAAPAFPATPARSAVVDDRMETSYTPVQDTRGIAFTEAKPAAAPIAPVEPKAPVARDEEDRALAAATVFSAASAPLISGADEPAPARNVTRTRTTVTEERVLTYTPETSKRAVELDVRPAPAAPALPAAPMVEAAPQLPAPTRADEPAAVAVTRAPVDATPDAKIEAPAVEAPVEAPVETALPAAPETPALAVNQAPVLDVPTPAEPAAPAPVEETAQAPNVVTTEPIDWQKPQQDATPGVQASDPVYGDILPPPKDVKVDYREPAEFRPAASGAAKPAPADEPAGDKDAAPATAKKDDAPAPRPKPVPKTDAEKYAEAEEPVRREGGLINKTKNAFLSVGESLRGAPEMVSENVSGAWNHVAPTVGEPIKRGGRTVVRGTQDGAQAVSTNTQKGYTKTKEFFIGKPVKADPADSKEADERPVPVDAVKADAPSEETPAIQIIGPDGTAKPLTSE